MCTSIPKRNAFTYFCRDFNATLAPGKTSTAQGSAVAKLYTHADKFYWQINVTDVEGLNEVVIADGIAGDYVDAVTLKAFSPAFSGSQSINGSFAGTDINPAVAGDIDELAGHVCMGHIFVVAKTTGGNLVGKITYAPQEGSTETCEEATVKYSGTETAPPAPAATPVSAAPARSMASAVCAAGLIAAAFLA